jgi:hypothetical protein
MRIESWPFDRKFQYIHYSRCPNASQPYVGMNVPKLNHNYS